MLLKPGSDRTSQVVVHGRVDGTVTALSYRDRKTALLDVVTTTLAQLRARHDVVVCEGAGSPAEINLRATDIANMGLARAADLPTIVVGDIDRGGVLAHLFGTLAVLEPADQALVAGFVVNNGSLTARSGLVALVAPGVENNGVIMAKGGRVALASGKKFSLDFYGDGMVQLAMSSDAATDAVASSPGGPMGAAVTNRGTIIADGGVVAHQRRLVRRELAGLM